MSAPTEDARPGSARRGRLLLASACLVLAACGSTPEPLPVPETGPDPDRSPLVDSPVTGATIPSSTPADATGRVPLWLAARDLGLTVEATGRPGERRLTSGRNEIVIAAGRGSYSINGRSETVPSPGVVEQQKALHLPAALVERLRRDLGGSARRSPPDQRSSAGSGSLGGVHLVIDAGHGADDPGAPNPHGPPEKVIALAIANDVVRLLRERGARVTTTRTGDTYPSLDDRVHLANRSGADLFVSVHANTAANPNAQGVEVFFPADGMRAQQSGELARLIANAVAAIADANNRGPKADPRGLRVLENTRTTAVLVETGFLSHAVEGRRLTDPSYQRRVAEGIVRGIEDYVARLR